MNMRSGNRVLLLIASVMMSKHCLWYLTGSLSYSGDPTGFCSSEAISIVAKRIVE
jgi:hypothetical protein